MKNSRLLILLTIIWVVAFVVWLVRGNRFAAFIAIVIAIAELVLAVLAKKKERDDPGKDGDE